MSSKCYIHCTKFWGKRPGGSGEDFFYQILALWPSWSCNLAQIYKFPFPHPVKVQHEIWLQSTKLFLRSCLKKVEDEGRWRHALNISQPSSLPLRWAKNPWWEWQHIILLLIFNKNIRGQRGRIHSYQPILYVRTSITVSFWQLYRAKFQHANCNVCLVWMSVNIFCILLKNWKRIILIELYYYQRRLLFNDNNKCSNV